VPIGDTSPAADAVQFEIHCSMSGAQRVLLAYEMSMLGRELNRARLKELQPGWTEAQINRELLRLAFFPQPLPAGLP
jgi:hypothetical protein